MAKEAYSRAVIDQKLKDVGWDILDEQQVQFEDHGVAGRADYVLKDKHGKPIALIEAKSPDIDPYSAKQQALNYAEVQYKGQIDYLYLANDHVIYFWDFISGGDAYPVPAFFSQDDLSRRRTTKQSTFKEPLTRKKVEPEYFQDIDPDIKLRPYQIDAWEALSNGYDGGKRSFLLEMATGTGKTVLAALMISRFLKTHQAQTVLFIVDRIELARQTKGVFERLLGKLSAVATYWGSSKKNLLGANIVVATIQSLISHGKEKFTPGYFDLIIHDEAHRSIYSPEARGAVDYFVGAIRIGLTATPKDFLKNIDIYKLREDDPRAVELRLQRDTYKYFDCESGQATFRYTIQDGVRDGFLVPPKLHKMTSVLTQEALSDQGLVMEGDYEDEAYGIKDLEKRVFVPARNEVMMKEIIEYAEKSPEGKMGKTLVFAVNQHHALELEKILNRLKPEDNGRFAQTITSRVVRCHELARDFKKVGNDLPRVAVSVDMLTTGYDAPEVQNIVLCRPVFEPTLYQQIKGRGTRLCKEIDKKQFVVFDFCGVCEYFEEQYDWEAPRAIPKGAKGKKVEDILVNDEIFTKIDPQEKPETPIIGRADIVGARDQIRYGPDGDKVDREMYQTEWAKSVKEFIEKVPKAKDLAEDEEKTEELIDLLNKELLNKPEYYFNEDNLSKSHRVIASVRDFFLSALGKKTLPERRAQVDDWKNGMLEKYGRESGPRSYRKHLMAKLILDQMLQNDELRQSIQEKPNINFLLQDPFTLGYTVDEWLNTFGKDALMQMVLDIRNSKILKI